MAINSTNAQAMTVNAMCNKYLMSATYFTLYILACKPKPQLIYEGTRLVCVVYEDANVNSDKEKR